MCKVLLYETDKEEFAEFEKSGRTDYWNRPLMTEERKIDSKNIIYLDSYDEFTDYEKLMFEKLVEEQEQIDKAFGMLEKYVG